MEEQALAPGGERRMGTVNQPDIKKWKERKSVVLRHLIQRGKKGIAIVLCLSMALSLGQFPVVYAAESGELAATENGEMAAVGNKGAARNTETYGFKGAKAVGTRQAEALDRGVIAIRTAEGVYLSWRYLGT